jgi:hypothetical protein
LRGDDVLGFRQLGEGRGVHPQEGQGVAQDKCDDNSGWSNHDERINNDDRGDYNDDDYDAAAAVELLVGAAHRQDHDKTTTRDHITADLYSDLQHRMSRQNAARPKVAAHRTAHLGVLAELRC